jgi:hypothetical protein
MSNDSASTTDPGRLPWEQQPGESARGYQGFVVYRDLEASRSLRKVAAQLRKNDSLIERWSSKHDWVVRAHAYDAHILQLRLNAREERLIQTDARREAIHTAIDEALLRRLKGDQQHGIEALEPGALKWQDIARLRPATTSPTRRPTHQPAPHPDPDGMVSADEAASHIRALIEIARSLLSDDDYDTLLDAYREIANTIPPDPPPATDTTHS